MYMVCVIWFCMVLFGVLLCFFFLFLMVMVFICFCYSLLFAFLADFGWWQVICFWCFMWFSMVLFGVFY